MAELKRCPCGETPDQLVFEPGKSSLHGYVYGDCCGVWGIEFRINGRTYMETRTEDVLRNVWNGAPRKNVTDAEKVRLLIDVVEKFTSTYSHEHKAWNCLGCGHFYEREGHGKDCPVARALKKVEEAD
jgi:hypothetical protein